MRIATILAAFAFAAATAAPANACAIQTTDSIFFQTLPDDLASNELVLEVKFEKAEPHKLPPFFMGYSTDIVSPSYNANYRMSVVRVVRGEFSGDTVIAPVSNVCGGVTTHPDGSETGLIIGFLAPPSPEWQDAPVMVVRYSGTLEFLNAPAIPMLIPPYDIATFTKALGGDLTAMKTLGRNARDPVARKLWFDRASAILRERVEKGDTSAMVELGLAMREGRAPDENPTPPPGVYVDPALTWLERAAALGDPRGMFLLAESIDHDSRRAVAERGREATGWYLKAAEAGHACAMGTLAQRYRFGWGGVLDKEQALVWYRKATAAGAIMSPYGYEIASDPPRGAPHVPALQCPSY